MTSIQTRVDQLKPLAFFSVVAFPLFLLFFITSSRGLPYNIDGMTNALSAWKLGTHGTVYLDEYLQLTGDEYYGELIWLVSTDDHVVSKYPPGTAALAAPAYFIAQSKTEPVRGRFMDQETGEWRVVEVALPSLVPAAIAASMTTSIALGLLGLVFRSLVSPSTALIASYAAGLGTPAWSVAADLLWQHGPAMMSIALALLMLQRKRYIAAGLAFGLAVLVRPQVAIIAAAAGTITALHNRSWKTLFQIGLASSLGLALYLGYNAIVFAAPEPIPAVAAGYFTEGLQSSPLLDDLGDLFLAFFDLERGMLLWSPFLLVLLPGLRSAWRAAHGWARGAAVGGFLYLAVQMRGNTFAGGTGFFSYRYPLEMLAASAPLLLLAYRDWVAQTANRRKVFQWAAIASITIHSVGAIAG